LDQERSKDAVDCAFALGQVHQDGAHVHQIKGTLLDFVVGDVVAKSL
jgi:hypothetical protein